MFNSSQYNQKKFNVPGGNIGSFAVVTYAKNIITKAVDIKKKVYITTVYSRILYSLIELMPVRIAFAFIKGMKKEILLSRYSLKLQENFSKEIKGIAKGIKKGKREFYHKMNRIFNVITSLRTVTLIRTVGKIFSSSGWWLRLKARIWLFKRENNKITLKERTPKIKKEEERWP